MALPRTHQPGTSGIGFWNTGVKDKHEVFVIFSTVFIWFYRKDFGYPILISCGVEYNDTLIPTQ